MEPGTPKELADHLRLLIDDEDFIARAVQLKFPQYGIGGQSHPGPRQPVGEIAPIERKPLAKRKADYAARNYVNSYVKRRDDWWAAEQSGKAFHGMVAAGTISLLAAIRREHPERCA